MKCTHGECSNCRQRDTNKRDIDHCCSSRDSTQGTCTCNQLSREVVGNQAGKRHSVILGMNHLGHVLRSYLPSGKVRINRREVVGASIAYACVADGSFVWVRFLLHLYGGGGRREGRGREGGDGANHRRPGLANAQRLSPTVDWASWANCLYTVQSRHPQAGEMMRRASLTTHRETICKHPTPLGPQAPEVTPHEATPASVSSD